MSVIQRGLRTSTRSKAVIGRVRELRAGEAPVSAPSPCGGALPRSTPLPLALPRSLSDDQQAAAEQLAEIFAEAEFEVWARGGPSGESTPADPLAPSPSALIARSAYRDAMRAVPVLLSPLVVHVCCLGLPLALWAAQKRLSPLQAEAGLRMALTHLASHFSKAA
ncbi:MAG: DUF6456 domain-containing protein [Elstera sp.]